LREELARDGESEHTLVDMAIIGSVLVFGQEAREDDIDRVTGAGFVRTDRRVVSHYRRGFQNTWMRFAYRMMPERQLSWMAAVVDMRHKMRKEIADGHPLPPIPGTGGRFFDQVIDSIEHSDHLRAVDVAPRTYDWVTKSEYRQFREATVLAASSHPDGQFARVYVLPDGMHDTNTATAFRDVVLRPQVEAGVELYLLHNEQVVTANCSASDCIFTEDWGFYLAPSEEFDAARLSAGTNTFDQRHVQSFVVMFNRLVRAAEREGGYVCRKPDELHDDRIVSFLLRKSHYFTERS
jgi:hypothetical protein